MKPGARTQCQSQRGLALSPDPRVVPYVVPFVAGHEAPNIMNRAGGA